jgi:hypothetical protein
MTEIKKTVIIENIDVLIDEANVTKADIKLCNVNGYTTYALYKSQQIASDILAAVKTTVTKTF